MNTNAGAQFNRNSKNNFNILWLEQKKISMQMGLPNIVIPILEKQQNKRVGEQAAIF